MKKIKLAQNLYAIEKKYALTSNIRNMNYIGSGESIFSSELISELFPSDNSKKLLHETLLRNGITNIELFDFFIVKNNLLMD